MEDMLMIAAMAAGDFAPWTCPRCESNNLGDTKLCLVCDEPKFGHVADVECECTMCTQALIEARRAAPRCRIEDYDVECECPACDAITGARESFLRLGDEY